MKYADLTGQIIGCAMKVHRFLGPGFPEVIYKRALVIEIEKIPVIYKSEVETDIYYEDRFIGKRRLDLIIDNKVLIELKAVVEVDKGCYAQIINYLRIFKFEVGLLLNFGAENLQFKRFINSKI